MNKTMKTAMMAGLLIAAGSVNAAIIWNENSDGDLNGQNLLLLEGVNTILGSGDLTVSDSLPGFPPQITSDVDAFSVDIGSGFDLTGFELTLLSVDENVLDDLAIRALIGTGTDSYRVEDGSSPSATGDLGSVTTGPAVPVDVRASSFGTSAGNTGSLAWTWSLDITIESNGVIIDPPPIDPPPGKVPEPSIPALLGLGLLGLFFMRRRRND